MIIDEDNKENSLQLITNASTEKYRLEVIELYSTKDVLALRSEHKILDANLSCASQDCKGSMCRLLNAMASYKIGNDDLEFK